jgi:hypothetical protein
MSVIKTTQFQLSPLAPRTVCQTKLMYADILHTPVDDYHDNTITVKFLSMS